MIECGYFTLKRQLHPRVEKVVGHSINYRTLQAVINGRRCSGPIAREIMKAISKILDIPIHELWPEVKSKKAA